MFRILVISAFATVASQASAQNCPDFFRFVDFGLQDSEGRFLRGGPIFRGESLEGRSLLIRDETQCRAIRDIASDGHGNPIPVVTRIDYDAEKTGINITKLQVSYVEDTRAAADENGKLHHRTLESKRPVIGPDFLCVVAQDMTSCQVASPYKGNVDLFIYCDLKQCRMPVLAVASNIQISATWAMDSDIQNEPSQTGAAISRQIHSIHAFLEPLTSGLN